MKSRFQYILLTKRPDSRISDRIFLRGKLHVQLTNGAEDIQQLLSIVAPLFIDTFRDIYLYFLLELGVLIPCWCQFLTFYFDNVICMHFLNYIYVYQFPFYGSFSDSSNNEKRSPTDFHKSKFLCNGVKCTVLEKTAYIWPTVIFQSEEISKFSY